MPGDTGRSQRLWFGSFQISQCRTNRYRVAAARANSSIESLRNGAQLGVRPPFAQPGVPQIVTKRSQSAIAKRLEDHVFSLPVVLAPDALDLVPVERDADDVHAEPVEDANPLLDRPCAELEPGVVLNAELHRRRGGRRRGCRGRHGE